MQNAPVVCIFQCVWFAICNVWKCILQLLFCCLMVWVAFYLALHRFYPTSLPKPTNQNATNVRLDKYLNVTSNATDDKDDTTFTCWASRCTSCTFNLALNHFCSTAPAEPHPIISSPWKKPPFPLQACSRSFKPWHPHLKLVSPVTCQKAYNRGWTVWNKVNVSALPRLNKCTVLTMSMSKDSGCQVSEWERDRLRDRWVVRELADDRR